MTDTLPYLSAPAKSALYTLLWTSDLEQQAVSTSKELASRVSSDWESFAQQAKLLGFDAVKHRLGPIDSSQGDEWDYAAHDFILTRNYHGSGFWDQDRWEPPWGDRLTDLCRECGELLVYVGDDGLLYPDPLYL